MNKGRRKGKKFKCEKRWRSIATGKVGDRRRVGGTDLGSFKKKQMELGYANGRNGSVRKVEELAQWSERWK